MTKEEKLMFGERLRRLRIENGLSQDAVSSEVHISLRYYQMLERGENVGSIDLQIELCDFFGCSLDYLLRGVPSESGEDGISKSLRKLTPKRRILAEKMLLLWIESLDE